MARKKDAEDVGAIVEQVRKLLSRLDPGVARALLEGYVLGLQHGGGTPLKTSNLVLEADDPLLDLHPPETRGQERFNFLINAVLPEAALGAAAAAGGGDGDPAFVVHTVLAAFNSRRLPLDVNKSPQALGLSEGGWNSLGEWVFDRIAARYPKFGNIADRSVIDSFFEQPVTAFLAFLRNCIRSS